MAGITLENITEAVINHGDKGKTNPRLHQIYSSLVKHLHEFQREVNLTTEELEIGRRFLFKPFQAAGDGPVPVRLQTKRVQYVLKRVVAHLLRPACRILPGDLQARRGRQIVKHAHGM